MGERPRVGISACLLGDPVRFDGSDKRDASLIEALAPIVDLVGVCPEADAGLGTPREPMQLVALVHVEPVAMVTIDSGRDVTGTIRTWAARRIDALAATGLSGFVLKSKSPSCGLAVTVFRDGIPDGIARGLFAEMLVQRFPDLPIDDEARLADPQAREAFVDRVFAIHRARQRSGRAGGRP